MLISPSSNSDQAAITKTSLRSNKATSDAAPEPTESFQPSGSQGGEIHWGRGITWGLLGGVAGATPILGGPTTGLSATLVTESLTEDRSNLPKAIAAGTGTVVGTTLNLMATAAMASGNWWGLGLLGAANGIACFYAGANLPKDI